MTLQEIKNAAMTSKSPCREAYGVINGKNVRCLVATGYRNTGKDSVRWSVDGVKVAAAKLQDALK